LSRSRLFALDHLKAFAIVAVVFTHSGTAAWIKEGIDLVLTRLWTPFHVPSFLFVSGFLYATRTPVGWTLVRRRLGRVLLPYAIASTVAVAAGVAAPATLASFAGMLATGSAVGVYYYVFVFCCCIPLLWMLSRMSVAVVAALWGACALLTLAQELQPFQWSARSIFWSIRNPLEHFMLGYFLSGWLAALWRDRLVAFHARHPVALLVACSIGAVIGALGNPTILHFGREWPRVLYSFSVIALTTQLFHRRTPGAVVRFLSEATLGLYLYHCILLVLAAPWTAAWPLGLRIPAQAAVGLCGATLLLLAARRLLGPVRARALVGA
jgi:fucose 4-O-acetylase-like acetyltransferase